MTNVRIGDEPGWEDKFQLRTVLKYLEENGYNHALVTQNGILMSTGTMTEHEAALTQKDAAYAERNKCVALIAHMAIALGLTAGRWHHEGEEEGWGWIVSVRLPNGWADWHIPDRELQLLENLPVIEREWESYTTEEKYERVLNPGL